MALRLFLDHESSTAPSNRPASSICCRFKAMRSRPVDCALRYPTSVRLTANREGPAGDATQPLLGDRLPRHLMAYAVPRVGITQGLIRCLLYTSPSPRDRQKS